MRVIVGTVKFRDGTEQAETTIHAHEDGSAKGYFHMENMCIHLNRSHEGRNHEREIWEEYSRVLIASCIPHTREHRN